MLPASRISLAGKEPESESWPWNWGFRKQEIRTFARNSMRAPSMPRDAPNEVEFQVEEGRNNRYSVAKADVPTETLAEARRAVSGSRITLDDAFTNAIATASSNDMANHFRSAWRVAHDFWGPIPLSSITTGAVVDLLMFARRLPTDHGKQHGKNRYRSEGIVRNKALEIASADAADQELRELTERLDLPLREKKAIIGRGLRPRLSHSTLKKIHAHLFSAIRKARSLLGYCGPEIAPAMEEFRARAKDVAGLELSEGREIRQSRIIRRSWSDERLFELFSSPIYRGNSGKKRHASGSKIDRDAIYWVPLINATMGLRPEETLQLHKSDVLRRNGIVVIHVNDDADKTIKSKAANRYVPVPEILLNLGFLDWVNEQRQMSGRHLFPEIANHEGDGRLSGIFGGRFTSIRKALSIEDRSEDFYALRKTFASRLHAAGVQDSDVRAVLGHAYEDITNFHYTDREIGRLKTLMDRVDYRIEVRSESSHGFPVICGCNIAERPRVRVAVELTDDGYPARISVVGPGENISWSIAPMKSWPCYRSEERHCDRIPAVEAAAKVAMGVGDRVPQFEDVEQEKAYEYLMSLN